MERRTAKHKSVREVEMQTLMSWEWPTGVRKN